MHLIMTEFDSPEVTLCGWQDVKIHFLPNLMTSHRYRKGKNQVYRHWTVIYLCHGPVFHVRYYDRTRSINIFLFSPASSEWTSRVCRPHSFLSWTACLSHKPSFVAWRWWLFFFWHARIWGEGSKPESFHACVPTSCPDTIVSPFGLR